jgi:AmiR/NasT family two-component response regulator
MPGACETATMRVLILEDDVLISMDIAGMVADLGHETIGPFRRVADAVEAIRSEIEIDFALLDHSVGPTSSEEAGSALSQRGIPFAFVTGRTREELPPAFADAPLLVKPVARASLELLLSGG